jgi:hypothetical protein
LALPANVRPQLALAGTDGLVLLADARQHGAGLAVVRLLGQQRFERGDGRSPVGALVRRARIGEALLAAAAPLGPGAHPFGVGVARMLILQRGERLQRGLPVIVGALR